MAETQRIEGVYEIRLEHAGAVRGAQAAIAAFKSLNKEAKGVSKEFLDLIKLAEKLDVSFRVDQRAPKAPRATRVREELPKIDTVDIDAAIKKTADLREESKKLFDQYKQGGSSEQVFTDINSALIETRAELTLNNRAIKDNAKAQRELQAVASASGVVTEEQARDIDRLTKEREQLKTVNASLKISEGQLSSVFREVGNEVKGLTENQLRFRDKMAQAFSGQSLKAELSSLATQYVSIGAAVYGAQRLIGGAIDTFVDYDKGLSKIRALADPTNGIAENIGLIGETAKTAGINFGFGATESLSAAEELLKAGLTVQQVLGGGLNTALTLAASGELDLARAAEITASTLTQFNIAGEESGRVADTLSAAANKGQGNVEDFAQALKFIGPNAASLKIPLEETVGAIAVFAENGIKGEQAGTGLRGVIQSLLSPSKEATSTFRELGIITEDGNNKLYDAQGNFKGLANLAEVLKTSTEGLTDAEKEQALGRIFGNQQITGAKILLKDGEQAIKDWTKAVTDQGIAERIAGEKTNNLSGDVNKLSAQYDALILSVENGDGVLSKAFRGATQSLTQYLSIITDATDSSKSFFERSAAGLASLTGLGAGITKNIVESFFSEEELKAIDLANEKGKAVAKSFDYAGANVAQLRDRLAELKGTQDSLSAQGLDATAKKYDREIAAVESLIGSKEKLHSAQKNGVAVTSEEEQAAKKSEVATQNTANSVADLTERIGKLQEQQAQSTDSAQFAAYQKQIDDLNTSLEKIRSTAGSDTPLIDQVFGKNLEALPPTDKQDPGTPLIDEIDAEERLRINADLRAAELSGVRDFNAEIEALDQAFRDGGIESLQAYNDQRNAILVAQAQRELNIRTEATTQIASLFTDAATGQIQDQRDFNKRLLLIAVDFAKKQAQIAIANASAASLAQPDSVATFGATGLARAAIMAALIEGVFASVRGLIQGLAKGGEVEGSPSGRVSQSWGLPVKRDNGDDVLVRTRRGHVTLKTGEVVLNERQQRRLHHEAGPGILGRIGVPGFRSGGFIPNSLLSDIPRHYHMQGLIDGGTVGQITPRPSPANIVSMQQTQALMDFADRPSYVSVVEINSTQDRVGVIESARSSS